MVDDECKEEYLSHRAVEYGVATHMLKREDAWCRCEDTDGCFTFGVFDGHGGAELSHKCSELLPAKLHDAASDRAIEDAFWEVDAELGRQALTQGTTASCLCIRPTEAGHDIMLAWVGDSRVIEVDMMAGSSNLVYRTSTFSARRQGGAVKSISAEHDKMCLLRFYGFIARTNRTPEGALLYLPFMIRNDIADLAQQYAEWLQATQRCKFSSIANYLNGLVSIVSYCYANLAPEDAVLQMEPNPLQQLINLRAQAEKV